MARLPALCSLAVVICLTISCQAVAHDYWISISPGQAYVDQLVTLRLYVGDGLEAEEQRAYNKSRTIRFERFGPDGLVDLKPTMSEHRRLPLLRTTIRKAGTYVYGMERGPASITLVASKFTAYLREEGLADVLRRRALDGQTNAPGRERYVRGFTSYVHVGPEGSTQTLHRFGFPIEIVPASDPTRHDSVAAFLVLFHGKPVAYHQIQLLRLFGGAQSRDTKKTDAEGRVRFTVPGQGRYLARLVHMLACHKSCAHADWVSYWSSLAFVR
jgi:hypothetical protein